MAIPQPERLSNATQIRNASADRGFPGSLFASKQGAQPRTPAAMWHRSTTPATTMPARQVRHGDAGRRGGLLDAHPIAVAHSTWR